MELVEESPYRFRIDRRDPMRVPGAGLRVPVAAAGRRGDKSLEQVANVATLPGIVGASFAMPDVHWGYGFPIGGVAGTDVEAGGVISPGGVGFDISCGVRLLAATWTATGCGPAGRADGRPGRSIPARHGQGRGVAPADRAELDAAAARRRAGTPSSAATACQRDLDRCEDDGAVDGAEPGAGQRRAPWSAALHQVGSLGSGNHFLEVQAVDEVYDEAAARAFGLRAGQVCVMIHCGSRGLGHQICTDHVRIMDEADGALRHPRARTGSSPARRSTRREGRAYLGAMAAAANYGRANRQLLAQAARRVFERVAGAGLDLVYDISHNLAKFETHEVDGAPRRLCVHRKGATRALPPGHPDLPADLRDAGQPVLIPGRWAPPRTSSPACRARRPSPPPATAPAGCMSRNAGAHARAGAQLRRRAGGRRTSWCAARPGAGSPRRRRRRTRTSTAVVAAAEGAGLSRRVARLVPLGVVKG